MTDFRRKFPFKNLELDNRIGILEQRIDMLEDEIVYLHKKIQR